MGKWCRLRATMEPPAGLMISDVTVLPMLKLRWVLGTWSWRKGKAFLQPLLSQSLWPYLILSFRGRRGLPATKCTLLKARSKAPSERASGGSRTSTLKSCMAGSALIYLNSSFLLHVSAMFMGRICRLIIHGLWSVYLNSSKLLSLCEITCYLLLGPGKSILRVDSSLYLLLFMIF